MKLREKEVALLREVLSATSGPIEGVNVDRFRAGHIKDVDVLEGLERKLLLDQDYSNHWYRVRLASLPLVDNPQSRALLSDCETIFSLLRSAYEQHLKSPVLLEDIANATLLSLDRVIECMTYIREGGCFSGRTIDPRQSDAVVIPAEKVLLHERFMDIAVERLDIASTNEDKRKETTSRASVEYNATKREDVLGAAVAMIVSKPQECSTRTGKYQGIKIAKLIDDHSHALFGGNAPLSLDNMSRLINKWLKTAEKFSQ